MVVNHRVTLGMAFHVCFVASSLLGEEREPGHPILADNCHWHRSLLGDACRSVVYRKTERRKLVQSVVEEQGVRLARQPETCSGRDHA